MSPTEAAPAPYEATSHLTPELWERASRLLIRKALAEFSHERLLTPEPLPDTPRPLRVRSDDGTVEYRFAARLLALDHWQTPRRSPAPAPGSCSPGRPGAVP
jgi:siderophore synthetase component